LFVLAFQNVALSNPVLRFALEPKIAMFLMKGNSEYISADLVRADADEKLDIEDIAHRDCEFDTLCSPVLEQVNDRNACTSGFSSPVFVGGHGSHRASATKPTSDNMIMCGFTGRASCRRSARPGNSRRSWPSVTLPSLLALWWAGNFASAGRRRDT
jgi:hypothetical protein